MGQNFSATTVVSGHVSPGYESVEEMFRGNLVSGKERNAQLCVYVGGECVVDLWGSAEGDPGYGGDSLQCVFSSSKARDVNKISRTFSQYSEKGRSRRPLT